MIFQLLPKVTERMVGSTKATDKMMRLKGKRVHDLAEISCHPTTIVSIVSIVSSCLFEFVVVVFPLSCDSLFPSNYYFSFAFRLFCVAATILGMISRKESTIEIRNVLE